MDIFRSTTVDPHESRLVAPSRVAESSAIVHLPVIVLQFGKGSYCGPSISKKIPRMIAIDARMVYSVKLYPAILWQLPRNPTHASNVHKGQSLTLPKIAVDAVHFGAQCSLYVSSSRVEEMRHLALVRLITWGDIEKHAREMNNISSHMTKLRAKESD